MRAGRSRPVTADHPGGHRGTGATVSGTAVGVDAGYPSGGRPSDEDESEVCRYRDPHTGVTAEVRTDGVPVGLAFPESLTDRQPQELASILLRGLVAAASEARELLERQAERDWDDAEELLGDADPDGPGAAAR